MVERFAGLDVSLHSTSVCVVSQSGEVVLEAVVPTEALQIVKVLRPFRRGLKCVAQETSGLAPLLHRSLVSRRLPAVCIHAKATRAALRAQRNKTDRNDARGIATLMSLGFAATVHVKSLEALELRALLTSRSTIKRKAIDIQMTLLGTQRLFGLTESNLKPRKRSVGPHLSTVGDNAVAALVRARAALLNELADLDRQVKKLAAADAVCRRLMTVPGVGPITALTFKGAVDDPSRFSSSRLVAAHFGLTPRRFQSGSMDITGRISKFGDGTVRAALYEAAMVMLVRSRTPTRLREWGLKLVARNGYKYAATACARKLAVLLHRLWIDESEFHPRHGM